MVSLHLKPISPVIFMVVKLVITGHRWGDLLAYLPLVHGQDCICQIEGVTGEERNINEIYCGYNAIYNIYVYILITNLI